MNRYRPFARITVIALVVLAGVFVTVRVLRDDLADLTTEWAPAATIVDVGARGAAHDHLEAIVAAGESEGPLTFGPYTINEQTAAAPLRQPTAPRDGVSGRVPEWFPVLDGAVQLSAEFSGQSEDPDTLASSDTAEPGLPSTYRVTQTSLVATDLTSEEVVTAITDAVGDCWSEFTEDTVSDYDWYETSMNSRRDGNNPDDVASIDIAAAGSDEFDGLVIVEVQATYHEAQRLRQQPLTAIAVDLSELASEKSWPMAAWSLGTGWLGYGAVATEQTIVTWAIDSSTDAATDAVVEVLGTPEDGDVDSDAANLVYGDGEVSVEGLETEDIRVVGHPRYEIEVGPAKDQPDLIAVYVNVRTKVAGPMPETPVFAFDYFADARFEGDYAGWRLTRWYVVEGERIDGSGVVFRGELDWTPTERGPDALEEAVATIAAASRTEPEEVGDSAYWFEGADDWAASLTWGRTYESVRVLWEGGPVPPDEIA